MMGSTAAAANMWYIEDRSGGTLATFPKRSHLDEDEANPSDLSKRQDNAVPLSELEDLDKVFSERFNESITTVSYASWPNPFAGLKSTTSPLRNERYLKIVDGSTNGQTIPLWSLIQPARHLDFIFAWDDSADARPEDWNNGTNLYNTYVAAKKAKLPFPIVPTAPTFIKNNYTHKPVFFGCDANLTTTKDPATPIVLYLANAPYSTYVSTSLLSSFF